MLKAKYTSDKIRRSGSPELLAALPEGMVNKLKDHFKVSYPFAHRVLNGKQYTDNGMPDAAMRILAVYKESQIEEKITKILSDYGSINKTRK